MVILTRKKFKIFFYSDSSDEKELIKKSLSWFHPEAENIKSFKDGYWDGIVRMYDGASFSIGLLKYPVELLTKNGVKIAYENFEKEDLSWVKFSDQISVENRDYQRDAIYAILQNRFGIVKVPTRGGKTFIAGETIRILTEINPNYRFLFLADSTDGFYQNTSDLATFLGKDLKEIGQIKEKIRKYGQVNVAMIQTMQSAIKRKDRDLLKFLKTVNVLIIDELQEYYSKERQGIILKIQKNLDYQIAISATPLKKSDFIGSLNIEKITGGIIFEIHQKELEQRKVLAENKVLLIINEIDPNKIDDEKTYFELLHEHVHESKQRNGLLHNIIEACVETNVKTLVMFASKQHGYKISSEANKAFLSGDDDAETRNVIKDAFLNCKGEVLCVSQIWKKAITLPEVEVFVNADGGKEDTLIQQKKGRVLGVTKDKTRALVIDIIDSCDTYFTEHSVSRIEVYEQSNTCDEIDFLENDKDFKMNLINYLKDWFNG